MFNKEGKCWICGVFIVYDEPKGNLNPTICKDVTEHKKWCRYVGAEVVDIFDRVFAGIYNVIELALDESRATQAKALIGRTIHENRNDVIRVIKEFMDSEEDVKS